MRKAKSPTKPVGAPASKVESFIAPVGGWRTDVALAEMPKDAATVMNNWFPEAHKIRMRRGYFAYATGMGTSTVETLLPYSGGGATKLLAACGGAIYDVSSSGAVGSALITGLTNSQWVWASMTNSAGKWLRIVNGFDEPMSYDGTTLRKTSAETSPITGPSSTSNLCSVTTFRSRMWFLEKNTTRLWYLGTSAIGGAATSLEVGDVMKWGGVLVAIGTWTIPVYSGVKEILVLMSDMGEIVLYDGSNPADATNWTLLGTFKIGRPLGNKPFLNIGGDLAIITENGVIPLSKATSIDQGAIDQYALTKPISPTWIDAASQYRTNYGWQIVSHPKYHMAYINVPVTGAAVQYVMNTATGAFCQFTNMNASCWVQWNDRVFFGSTSGTVYEAEIGANDNGSAIDGICVLGYRSFGSEIRPKYAKLLSLRTEVGLSSALFAGISQNYSTSVPASSITPNTSNAARWGISLWGVGLWGGTTITNQYVTIGSSGGAIAPTIRGLVSGSSSSDSIATVISGELVYEQGAPVS